MTFEEKAAKIEKLLARKEVLEERLAKIQKRKKKFRKKERILLKTRSIINDVSQHVQKQTSKMLSDMVTEALKIIDDPYTFYIEFVQSRNKTEARLVLLKHGIEHELFYGSGGGIADLVSFALRMTFWASKKDARPIFIFDEPFKDLSKGYQEAIKQFIHQLSQDFNAQFIIVAAHGKGWEDVSNCHNIC